ncbi:MAG: aldolase catalytic domain-containing protein [Lachnospiraceae bacterium]|nr:aldolase catalytic domain-containing protein [Lachnospiraceae bacterium]
MNENDVNLISYRPDIRVLDATVRDGGLVNNFAFTDDFVRSLYHANIAAGVDYMEFGYKASKTIFKREDFGPWKFCDEEDIRRIVGDNDSPLKIAVMADVGRTDYKTDILPKKDSVIDLVRVATYIHQIPTAIEMIEDAKEKGYEVSVNIMAVSKVNDEDLNNGLRLLGQSSADVIYLVDSFGAFYPEQIRRLADRYLEVAEKTGKKVGIHAHNNQQLAFANTIEVVQKASYFDATVCGMGRGAGNCFMESLLGFLKNPKYNLAPIMYFVEHHMLALKEECEKNGTVWGYDIPYLLTGIMNSHPSSAIKFLKENRTDYVKFANELLDNFQG